MQAQPSAVPCPVPGMEAYTDPLEQFDVLPVVGTFTNLSFIFTLILILIGLLLCAFQVNGRSTYDFTLRNIYQLVRSIVRENITIFKQYYFSVIFYLFAVLLLANLVGLLPYSFTVTSSFVVTFFIALGYFISVNTILAVFKK
jgi:F-type H+-transporting ATPase subunit a